MLHIPQEASKNRRSFLSFHNRYMEMMLVRIIRASPKCGENTIEYGQHSACRNGSFDGLGRCPDIILSRCCREPRKKLHLRGVYR